jgi:2-polyprenyl-6-methoxyphenol hydroxylase-like FAD-dependent oxidoreductase
MAVELSRHGARFALIDDDEGPTPLHESRALGIQARTQEVLRRLGVVDKVLAEGRLIRGAGIYSEDKRIAGIEFDPGGVQSAYTRPIVLAQSRTVRILIDRLATLGGSVAWRTKLYSLTQDSNGVSVQLAGPSEVRQEIRAGWLVGCDGSRSAVRRELGLAFEGEEYEELFLIADVQINWPMPEDEFVIDLTVEGPLVAFPFPEPGRWRLVDTTGLVNSKDPESIVGRFRELLNHHIAPGVSVSEPSWTSAFRIHRRVVNSYRVGRCFVAGNAAHVHSPAGGQGMNTGIQDAFNLAWKLALVTKGLGRDLLLDSYNAERRPVALSVLRGTDLLTRMVTLHNPVARGLRNRLLFSLSSLSTLRRKASVQLSELAVNYRQSPIVGEDKKRVGLPRWDLVSRPPATSSPLVPGQTLEIGFPMWRCMQGIRPIPPGIDFPVHSQDRVSISCFSTASRQNLPRLRTGKRSRRRSIQRMRKLYCSGESSLPQRRI